MVRFSGEPIQQLGVTLSLSLAVSLRLGPTKSNQRDDFSSSAGHNSPRTHSRIVKVPLGDDLLHFRPHVRRCLCADPVHPAQLVVRPREASVIDRAEGAECSRAGRPSTVDRTGRCVACRVPDESATGCPKWASRRLHHGNEWPVGRPEPEPGGDEDGDLLRGTNSIK